MAPTMDIWKGDGPATLGHTSPKGQVTKIEVRHFRHKNRYNHRRHSSKKKKITTIACSIRLYF